MKVAVPLAKNTLAPLKIATAALTVYAGIQIKKKYGSDRYSDSALETNTLIILNKGMGEIMKIDQTINDSHILLKGVTKTIKNETKEQKEGFFGMLLGTILLGNMLAGKGMLSAGYGNKIAF